MNEFFKNLGNNYNFLNFYSLLWPSGEMIRTLFKSSFLKKTKNPEILSKTKKKKTKKKNNNNLISIRSYFMTNKSGRTSPFKKEKKEDKRKCRSGHVKTQSSIYLSIPFSIDCDESFFFSLSSTNDLMRIFRNMSIN